MYIISFIYSLAIVQFQTQALVCQAFILAGIYFSPAIAAMNPKGTLSTTTYETLTYGLQEWQEDLSFVQVY